MRREQTPDQVAASLRAAIMTGALGLDTYIRLDETAARMGVSVTPVWEALRTLRGQGMVELEPRRGYRVVHLTRTDLEDIFWLQLTIVAELAAKATRRIADDEIDELDRLNERLAVAVQHRDRDEMARAELSFHRAFNRSGRRVKLAWFLMHSAWYLPLQALVTDPTWGTATVTSHAELIDALREDAAAVVELTRGQFTDALGRLTTWLDQTEPWAEA